MTEEKVLPSDVTDEETKVLQGMANRGWKFVSIAPGQQGSDVAQALYLFYNNPDFHEGVQKLLKEVGNG
jgi:hypothetical protein